MTHEELLDLRDRLGDVLTQLQDRAKLYALLHAPEISEEFDRLARVEIQPMIALVDRALADKEPV